MSSTHTLLMVEDSLSLAGIYMSYLESLPVDVYHSTTISEALRTLETTVPDIVLLDIELPDGNGMDLLGEIKEKNPRSEVIVMTAFGSSEMALKAIETGAFDFLTKPFDSSRLLVTLNNAIDHYRLNTQVESYESLSREQYCGFIGQSLPMQSVYKIIDSLASTDATGFIVGESGTGKELTAEAIHQQSNRRNKPFIALNCAAIPTELMESQLFGHVKGAFTGATSDRQGIASEADGGTLFLDEICEMDLELQKKLLRFVQTGTIQKVGSNRLDSVDVRFVCATNKDPMMEVREGRFREDLYYRLHVVPIHLPPLRDRSEDVIAIAEQFVGEFSAKNSREFSGLSTEVKDVFLSYQWPGNVRELQNVLQNIIVLNDGTLIEPHMLPEHMLMDVVNNDKTTNSDDQEIVNPAADLNSKELQEVLPLWLVEKNAINHAIEVCDGQINKAADLLEVASSTLYRKIQIWEKDNKQAGGSN